MHLTDVSVGALRLVRDRRRAPADRRPASALAARYRGTDAVSALLLRRRRDEHRRLPRGAQPRRRSGSCRSIFVCENNLYGEYSPLAATTPIERARRPRRRLRDGQGARRRQRRRRRPRDASREAVDARPRRRRARRYRGADLPPQGPLAHRPGDVPPGRASSRRGSRATRSRARARRSPRRGRRRGERSRRCARTPSSAVARGAASARSPGPTRRPRRTLRRTSAHERRSPTARRSSAALADAHGGRRRACSCSARTSAPPAAPFKTTEGLFERFGAERVLDTPISEQAIVGAAIGAAITRPAAGRRDHVRRLRRRLLRPDRQRAGQVPLHDRRPGDGAGDHPARQRRRRGLRRAALADVRELVPRTSPG